jgi:hypothetical protein
VTPTKGDNEKSSKKEAKAKINQQGVQQIVKILGRQPDKDAKPLETAKPAPQSPAPQTAKPTKATGENDHAETGAGGDLTRKQKERQRQQRREQERKQRQEAEGEASQQPAKDPSQPNPAGRGGGRGSRGRGYLGNRGGIRGGGRGN